MSNLIIRNNTVSTCSPINLELWCKQNNGNLQYHLSLGQESIILKRNNVNLINSLKITIDQPSYIGCNKLELCNNVYFPKEDGGILNLTTAKLTDITLDGKEGAFTDFSQTDVKVSCDKKKYTLMWEFNPPLDLTTAVGNNIVGFFGCNMVLDFTGGKTEKEISRNNVGFPLCDGLSESCSLLCGNISVCGSQKVSEENIEPLAQILFGGTKQTVSNNESNNYYTIRSTDSKSNYVSYSGNLQSYFKEENDFTADLCIFYSGTNLILYAAVSIEELVERDKIYAITNTNSKDGESLIVDFDPFDINNINNTTNYYELKGQETIFFLNGRYYSPTMNYNVPFLLNFQNTDLFRNNDNDVTTVVVDNLLNQEINNSSKVLEIMSSNMGQYHFTILNKNDTSADSKELWNKIIYNDETYPIIYMDVYSPNTDSPNIKVKLEKPGITPEEASNLENFREFCYNETITTTDWVTLKFDMNDIDAKGSFNLSEDYNILIFVDYNGVGGNGTSNKYYIDNIIFT